jgi:5'-phosphate synthase pdxT subunit
VDAVGVLALQGDFAAHLAALQRTGRSGRPVKAPEHLAGISALLLPGGESTTMLTLLRATGLWEPLLAFCRSGRPVLGTCAGAILLARRVLSPEQPSLGVLDVEIERNGYGRQGESFVASLTDGAEGLLPAEGVFIRAPIIRATGAGVVVLVRHEGHPVLVRQGPLWASTYHPEMSSDPRLLEAVLRNGA